MADCNLQKKIAMEFTPEQLDHIATEIKKLKLEKPTLDDIMEAIDKQRVKLRKHKLNLNTK